MSEKILEVKDLKVYFNRKSNIFSKGEKGQVKAVDHVNLSINRNEIHGLVGESGSGKTTLGKTIMSLNPITSGDILFNGKSIKNHTKKERIKIQMIFQNPYSSFNPNMKIKQIIAEPIIVNKFLPKKAIQKRLEELMEMVHLPVEFLERYPHQLSGGQKQRVGVARAMALEPELIVADEPTSALDVSVQAQLLNLLLDLKNKSDVSILFISHNLAVVRHISDSLSVMQKGKIVESDTTQDVFINPQHEYTKTLIDAIPVLKKAEKITTRGEVYYESVGM